MCATGKIREHPLSCRWSSMCVCVCVCVSRTSECAPGGIREYPSHLQVEPNRYICKIYRFI